MVIIINGEMIIYHYWSMVYDVTITNDDQVKCPSGYFLSGYGVHPGIWHSVALLTTVKHAKYWKRANGLWVIRCYNIDDLVITKSIIMDYNKLLARKSWNRLYWVITKKWLIKWFIKQQTLMFLMTTHMIVHFPYFHQAPSFIGWWLKKNTVLRQKPQRPCSDKFRRRRCRGIWRFGQD